MSQYVCQASPSSCPVCDATLRFWVQRRDKYAYWHCSSCGHVTSLPMPTQEELTAFYDGFLFGQPTGSELAAMLAKVGGDVERILADIRRITGLQGPIRLLDWGGGTGFYANAFAQAGLAVTMMDIDPQSCAYATEKFGGRFEVINADPIAYDTPMEFDIVFCNQVIEHYAEPRQLMRRLRDLLTPGGIAIITTPNQQCKEFWFRPHWFFHYLGVVRTGLPVAMIKFLRVPWACCDPPRHVHAFCSRSLHALLEKEGFETLSSFSESILDQYYSTGRDPMNWKFRRWVGILRIAFDAICRAGLRLLDTVDTRRRWGSNLVAYARASSGKVLGRDS